MTQRGLFVGESRRQLPLTDDDCPLETPERPCPFVSCRYHLFVDQDVRWVGNRKADGLTVNPLAVRAVGRDVPPDEWTDEEVEVAIEALPESCALDLSRDCATEQTKVAKLMGLGRTLVEKIEHEAIAKLRMSQGDQHSAVGAHRPAPRNAKARRGRLLVDGGGSQGERQCDLPWGGLAGSEQGGSSADPDRGHE